MEDDFVALHSTIRRCFDDQGVEKGVVSLEGIFFFFFWKLWNISFSNLSKEDNKLGEKSMKNK